MEFEDLLEKYTKLMHVKGYSKTGQKMYIGIVGDLFDFLKCRGYAQFEISGTDMADYYQHLTTRSNKRREGTLSDTYINHNLYGIKLFFTMLLESKMVDALPLLPNYLRNEKEPLGIVSVDEIKRIYEACHTALERALLSAAYGCGLRRSEIVSLQLSDLDLPRGNLIVRLGKNNKRREIPMSDKVIEDFKNYIHHERVLAHRNHSVFITAFGNSMNGNTMNLIIRAIANRLPELSNRGITLHTMRRSIATHLSENGAGIHFVKEFLGHSEIDTSQLYAIRRKRQTKIIL